MKRKSRMEMPTAVALFCGCGGFTEGFRLAGIRTDVANDINLSAMDTFVHNHPGAVAIRGDIRLPQVQDEICLAVEGSTPSNRCDVMVGGPPCQSFSLAGLRNPDDPRGKLFQNYFELVKRLQPKVCVAENVKGILSMNTGGGNGTKVMDWICNSFEVLGYKVQYAVLDAAWYGVPQHRERVIFIAFREGRVSWARTTNGKVAKKPFVSVREAIDELRHLGENDEWSHVFTRHSPEFLEKIRATKPGESVTAFKGAFYRLEPDEPSKTVMANNGSCFIHYDLDRVLTPREMSKLQGFGYHYRFCGSKYDQLVQIGNAVPVGLAKAVGETVMRLL